MVVIGHPVFVALSLCFSLSSALYPHTPHKSSKSNSPCISTQGRTDPCIVTYVSPSLLSISLQHIFFSFCFQVSHIPLFPFPSPALRHPFHVSHILLMHAIVCKKYRTMAFIFPPFSASQATRTLISHTRNRRTFLYSLAHLFLSLSTPPQKNTKKGIRYGYCSSSDSYYPHFCTRYE
jgi:hypothetical protein